jgi:hypothetical protein
VSVPEPELWVLDAEVVPHAAEPTIAFRMRAKDRSGREVYTIALRAQIHLEPIQRAHDHETRERLADIFGEPARWGDTARMVLWARREVLVPSFTGSTTFELQVPCGSDLEAATARYVEALPGGEVPLAFHFSGSVLYSGDGDRLQLTQVPWHSTAQHRLPVETWRRAVGEGGVLRLGRDSFEALRRHRDERSLPTLEAALEDLLGVRAG